MYSSGPRQRVKGATPAFLPCLSIVPRLCLHSIQSHKPARFSRQLEHEAIDTKPNVVGQHRNRVGTLRCHRTRDDRARSRKTVQDSRLKSGRCLHVLTSRISDALTVTLRHERGCRQRGKPQRAKNRELTIEWQPEFSLLCYKVFENRADGSLLR